jgi:hypothetical protein
MQPENDVKKMKADRESYRDAVNFVGIGVCNKSDLLKRWVVKNGVNGGALK